jgi:hypothetical protein
MQAGALVAGRLAPCRAVECTAMASTAIPQHSGMYKLPSLRQFSLVARVRCSAALQRRLSQRLDIVATYPEPETEKERSPIDFPQVSTMERRRHQRVPIISQPSTPSKHQIIFFHQLNNSPNPGLIQNRRNGSPPSPPAAPTFFPNLKG